MNILQTNNAVKRREPDFTLGPIDLKLEPGEILGVMGPNGAGKTTLLRLLWGFLRPDAGTVSVFGRSPHLEQLWVRRRAGFMPESLRFYEWMSGRQFLRFMAGFYPAWDWEQADNLAESFDLDLGKTVETLSKGNRAKLGLIAAATHRPELIILDEPTGGLDPIVRLDILDTLRRIAVEQRTGVILSSHVSDDLDRIADTVLMLDRGAVLEYSKANDLLGRYSHTRLEEVFLDAIGRIPTSRNSHRA